jgi:hypothetical protein
MLSRVEACWCPVSCHTEPALPSGRRSRSMLVYLYYFFYSLFDLFLSHVCEYKQHINKFDSDKRNNYSANTVDKNVQSEQAGS